MNKTSVFGAALLIIVLTSIVVSAELAMLDDTTIDYLPYREIAEGQQGVVYQLKIINTGSRERTYEILPNTDSIREIGSYRIDPSDRVTIRPGSEETVYFYLSNEKGITSRKSIPLEIKSGTKSISINLVARSIGSFEAKNKPKLLESGMKIVFYTLIIILIIILTIRLFSRRKKEGPKNEEENSGKNEPEIETYY